MKGFTETAEELLKRVVTYYRGEGEYHFTGTDESRANQAFDAWLVLLDEIETHLARASEDKDGSAVKARQ